MLSLIKVPPKSFADQFDTNKGQNYGLSLFDGIKHQEQLACLEINGINRYLTGLNEFAPEVKKLPKEKRRVKQNDNNRK